MTGLETFALGLFTNGAYDILKSIFGASYDRLKELVENKNETEFTKTLQILFESNSELEKKLEELKRKGEGDYNSYTFEKDSNPKGNFGNDGVYNEG